jgi:hypothetical protein
MVVPGGSLIVALPARSPLELLVRSPTPVQMIQSRE